MIKSTFRNVVALFLTLGAITSANAGLFGLGGTNWKEEALLHDGSSIIVERTTERGGRHEIGQEPPIRQQSLSFDMPGTHERIVWQDKFSEDVGGANFNLKLLDIFAGTPYVMAMPAGCLSYNKWGRPNPPYVVFKYDGREWERIPLQQLPLEIRTPNLIPSSPDHEAQKAGGSVVSAAMIKRMYEDNRQPEYRTILREPVKASTSVSQVNCIETDYYHGVGWLSPDWFSDQPSLEACLAFCLRKKISSEQCPCSKFHRGEK